MKNKEKPTNRYTEKQTTPCSVYPSPYNAHCTTVRNILRHFDFQQPLTRRVLCFKKIKFTIQ